ncbi:DrmE family protein [Micromonospora sp. CA-269861]|uniref:DrmE family protein n=1 Tax=Micromonospora sp. CA-269861 TaxID=3239968 RepID=UPI003D8CE395
MIRDSLRAGRAGPSPLRIGVVATDPRLRGFYRALAVSSRPGGAGEPLRSTVAAATVGRNGRLSVIDRDDGRWSTVFVDSVAAARALDNLDLLVVDLPVGDADAVSEVGVPTVVVARDPADPAVVRLARRMPAFGYDWVLSDSVRADVAPLGGWTQSAGDGGTRIGVLPVECPALCADAGLFWADISTLARLGRRSAYVSTLLAQVFGLFHDLVGLAMPVSVHDRLAGVPLRERIGALARAARVVADGELRADWLPMVEVELAGMLQALDAAERELPPPHGAPPATKAQALPEAAADVLDAGKDALLVARTAALARMYTEYLRDSVPAVRVTSLGALATCRPADVAILLGAPPTWGRWVYRSRVARQFVVLAYTPEASNGNLPAPHRSRGDGPFDEVAVVADAVRMQKAAGLRLSLPRQRNRAWTAVRMGSVQDGATAPDEVGELGLDDVGLIVARPPEVPPGLWDGKGWTAQLEPRGATGSVDEQADAGGTDVVAGLRVLFDDGSWAWLRADSPVWRWRSHARRTEPVDAGRIAVGDELVFIDGDAHKTLLAKILEVAEDVPELAVAGTWVAHWRTALARAHARCGSYASLARQLAAHGCTVQTQTVRLWCIGVTLGPEDPTDLRRLGLLLNDDALTTRYEAVWRAMQTLRHAHVRLGRRLAALTRSLGPAGSRGALPADEVLDAASGLTAADVETAVVVLTVARIEPAPAVPALMTGPRRPADEPADSFHLSVSEEIR